MLQLEPRQETLPATTSPSSWAPAPDQPATPPTTQVTPVTIALKEPLRLAPDVTLVGQMEGTGFESNQWLVQRGDKFIQLSELIYRVVEQIDGQHSIDEIAAAVAEATGRPVSANNVRYLLEKKILLLGLIDVSENPEAAAKLKARKPNVASRTLQLTLKFGFIGPKAVERFARWLQYLYWPPLLVVLSVLALATHLWLYFGFGALRTIQNLLDAPALLLLVSIGTVSTAIFHEFGHASALRYGGGRARGIGFGVYVMYPAFYTDCTDSYRLGRWARLRTDLGGIYFDLITTVLLMGAFIATHQVLLLAAILAVDLEIIDQFNPLMRFDGYWALADLVGVPDFFVLMGPVVRGSLPKRWRKGNAPPLKGWVRVVFLAYTLITVPILAGFFLLMLAYAPVFLVTYYNSFMQQVNGLFGSWAHHDWTWVAISLMQGFILLMSAYFIVYMVRNLFKSAGRLLLALAKKSRRGRAAAILLLGALVVFLWFFWSAQLGAVANYAVRVAQQSEGYQVGHRGLVYVPPPTTVPSPGTDNTASRTTPNQHTVAVPTPTPTPVPQTGSQPVAQSDPTAKNTNTGSTQTQPQPKSDPGSNPGSKGGHNPGPTPKPKPKPTIPPNLPITIPTITIPPYHR